MFWEVPGIKNGILEVITTEVIRLANKLLDQVEDVKSPTYSHVGSFMVILRDRVIYTCHPFGQGHLYLSSFWTASFIPFILRDRVIYTFHPFGQGHLYLSSLGTGSFIPVILLDRVIYTCHPYGPGHLYLSSLWTGSFIPVIRWNCWVFRVAEFFFTVLK